tara:strand:+ start:351 stop:503 length:153 start_codon:yes stop_codon:yes gene_type:complete
MFKAIKKYFTNLKIQSDLSKLTDAELKDIGLYRSDLAYINRREKDLIRYG